MRTCTAALAGMLAIAACSDGGSGPAEAPLSITTEGRLERGETITLHAARGSTTLAPGTVSVSVAPAASAQVLQDGTMKLLAAGRLAITATAGTQSTTLGIDVATPPVIVFDKLVGDNRDIYRVALDGQDLTRLTTDPGDDQQPTAARDLVVFVSFRSGNADLYSIPLAGGVERRLTTTTAFETSPTLSPAADRLAWVSDESGVPRVWLGAADASGGSAAAAGFTPPGSLEVSPAWSSTGDRLVFVSTTPAEANLYTLTIATRTVSPIAVGATPNLEPAWSRDGNFIAFFSGRAGGAGLYRVDLRSGAVSLLVPGSVGQPTWLADGRLVFTDFATGTPRLRWIDPAQPAAVRDINTGPGGAAQHASAP